jgi:3-isopropylmalate/(R)-2-methylmalate dehydratase small subunit
MPKPFTRLSAIAAPIMRTNIDTDVIIRIERSRDLQGDALGPYAFESWRYRPDGSEEPAFVLNRKPYRDAKIILAGDNFGCGSSRETAVLALWAFGIRCVVAPSFGPIFFNNCFQIGLLPVILPLAAIEALVAELAVGPESATIRVDLEKCIVLGPGGAALPFTIDRIRREGLLQGMDQIALTRTREPAIVAFEAQCRDRYPWVYAPASHTTRSKEI